MPNFMPMYQIPQYIRKMRTGFTRRGLIALAVLLMSFYGDFALAAAPLSGNLRIIAIVNDEPITEFDIISSLKFQLLQSGQIKDGDAVPTEAINSLSVNVLRSIIQNKLILQEMKRRRIDITDKEVTDAIADFEAENKLKPGSLMALMARNNVPKSVLIDQQRAQIGWPRTISRRIQAASRVSDNDVDAALDSIKANAGKMEYLISEIDIIKKSDESDDEMQERAEHVLKRLNQNADFDRLARGFSDSPSSNDGGDLGWISQEQLDANIAKIIPNLAKNTISGIVKTKIGLSIIKLRDKRENKHAPDQLSREQLQNHLFMQRINSEGRRYLRELQFNAIIDVKQG